MISDLPFSPAFAATIFNASLADQSALVMVLDIGGPKGALIAHVAPYPLGPALLAKEVVFWIEPEHRGPWARKMMAEYIEWARGAGAMICGLSCFNDGRTHKLFERAGFTPIEINTVKVL